jgi:hypothetical protein
LLSLATAVAYLVLIVLVLRRADRIRAAALGLLLPAAVCSGYTVVLAAGNTGKVGFSAGSLILSAVPPIVAAVTTAIRTAAARQSPHADAS